MFVTKLCVFFISVSTCACEFMCCFFFWISVCFGLPWRVVFCTSWFVKSVYLLAFSYELYEFVYLFSNGLLPCLVLGFSMRVTFVSLLDWSLLTGFIFFIKNLFFNLLTRNWNATNEWDTAIKRSMAWPGYLSLFIYLFLNSKIIWLEGFRSSQPLLVWELTSPGV